MVSYTLYTGFHYTALRYVRLLLQSARPDSAANRETLSLLLTVNLIDSASIILALDTNDVQNNVPLLTVGLRNSPTRFETLD